MTARFTKGKARTETPRLKDLPLALVRESAPDPAEGRDEGGRFAPGNRHSVEQGIKALIRRGLGDPSDPTTGELTREALKLYNALRRGLPSDGPGVRQLVAAQARHATLAGFYANEAARVGLATPEGLKLAEASRAHDTTAQRLATTAYDRAVREGAARRAAEPPAWRALLGLDQPAAPTAPASMPHAPAETVSGPGAATATPAEEGAPEGHPEPAPATDLEEPAR
ncbi:MAG TPA: hypothetical protein PLU22_00925 [Polyangiaceae bacterium]|nr:hypothetical protein [Polyangiaceae bacterium]